jgi:hypothetical protein
MRRCPLQHLRQSPLQRPLHLHRNETSPWANWRGDATVLSRSGNAGCGWGTSVGEEREGVLWRVTVTGESVLLDEDMSNWPTDHISFSGTLSGQSFTARYYQGDDYARWVCQFREATLVGQFSPDLSTFEALETLVWGVPGTRNSRAPAMGRRPHVTDAPHL